MKKLIDHAIAMMEKAYAPYSKYKVGAAVLTEDETIISGCNVESSSYGLTCCAERTALFTAVSKGHLSFKALAVAWKKRGTAGGACRQVIWDLCGNIPVYITDEHGNVREKESKILLPDAFDENKL